ncbi:MAG: glycosyl hydrolase family 30 [Melioribacteraceae bacterium]|nr:glycosyl hydrolase family 30 [Melioribacteraceae bacterium]
MKKHIIYYAVSFMTFTLFLSCGSESTISTKKIIVTSERGDKLAVKENVPFVKGNPEGNVIEVDPSNIKQTIDGIGTSFTESSAFVLAHLEKEKRLEVMKKIFSEEGANFTLTRTHIGACDFTVNGKYSYLDKEGDTKLESFSIQHDKKGFNKNEHPGIEDEYYDLLPMIKEALTIKSEQNDKELKIVSSAWTAPPWMKDIEDWFIKGIAGNNYQGTGGSLKSDYQETYADYLIKYLDTYRDEGVEIWGITPVNEPHGNNGQWESMHFTPESQRDFIKKYLGPKLKSGNNPDVKLLIYDQNRDGLEHWTDVILGDAEAAKYAYGTAVHWYESTYKVYEDVFEKVNKKFPEFAIIHTEGCIDDLGKDAPGGINDPEKFKESNWFNNDSFWWNDSATDWGYSATWENVNMQDHPAYTPVHRYARNIIVSIDHWLRGWIDWNIVLDRNGGPNHVGNYCGAPIMIDTDSKEIYYTPIYYVLAQFSRTIRPGDKAVQTKRTLSNLHDDALHACATMNKDNLLSVQLLNTTKNQIEYRLKIKNMYASLIIDANSIQTVQIQL